MQELCFNSFVLQLDFIETIPKAALEKSHTGKIVKNVFLGCVLFLFHSPPTQAVNLGYLWVYPLITTLLYFEMLTSYFNTLVEEAIPVAPQVCSSSASKAVQKPSSQLSGRWLPLLEAAPGAAGLTWDPEIFDLLLCSWNS